MIFQIKKSKLKILYIFFIVLSLNLFFFSTDKVFSKSFDIQNVDISRPFEINFDKNDVIDEGFNQAFFELISLIVNSEDREKIDKIKLNKLKGMIESFSIQEEKFINDIYYVNLGVSFNKKKIYNYLESKNIFPSTPTRKKFLFIPIIIDENKKDLLLFHNNKIFENWNKNYEKTHLIEYILPTEDLEDLNHIRKNYENIEQYDFDEIISKYDLKDSIISLFFRGENKLRVLTRITFNKNVVLKNQSFSQKNISDIHQIEELIKVLKTVYEDHWKKINQINTSIKLSLNIKIDNKESNNISDFEKDLDNLDLINDYFITKFDKDFTFYQVIFNGTPNIFLKIMEEKNYNFDTQNKIWSIN
tara:strand:- start:1405 stop:2484 length:1080 start_codon:yes stop_codon:yes gene_type:complete